MKHLLISTVAAFTLAACATPVETADETPQVTVVEKIQIIKTVEEAPDYTPTGWTAKTLPELADALKSGEVTAEELTQAYLDRIEAVDRNGPTLQAVLILNPTALDDARALDAKRAAGEPLGALHGIPILLKDNIESKDPMPTTAGALVLAENVTGRDSPLVAGLRAEGAIILGKTNLSQWANFRSNDSNSGWSALGGQVRNPHMLDRNPCGSSSGSGAGMAASLAAGTVGTETNGSVSCPSTVNGIVGFKPTVGLVSQQYIVPISSTQDTAGPMTKTVKGSAMMLNAMATGAAKTDYVTALDAGALAGKRVGVLRFAEGGNKDIIALFDNAVADMEAAGAILVDIEEGPPRTPEERAMAYDVLKFEFKATLNDYLAETPETVTHRTLKDVIAFNEEHADVELALFGQDIFEESEAMGGLDTPEYEKAHLATLKATQEDGIDKLLADYDVDFLVSPSGPLAPRIDPINGDVWPQWAGAGWLAALAGYPHLTVPMGTVHGLPVGVSFMAGKDADAEVLSVGYAYEQATMKRAEPQYLPNAEARPEIAKAVTRP